MSDASAGNFSSDPQIWWAPPHFAPDFILIIIVLTLSHITSIEPTTSYDSRSLGPLAVEPPSYDCQCPRNEQKETDNAAHCCPCRDSLGRLGVALFGRVVQHGHGAGV